MISNCRLLMFEYLKLYTHIFHLDLNRSNAAHLIQLHLEVKVSKSRNEIFQLVSVPHQIKGMFNVAISEVVTPIDCLKNKRFDITLICI